MGVGFGVGLAELLRSAFEENGPVGFGEEESENEGAAGVDEGYPEDPAPSDCGCRETTENGCEKGSPNSCLIEISMSVT